MKRSEIPSNICWKSWTYQPLVMFLISSPHTSLFSFNNCKMGHFKSHQQCATFCLKNRITLACRRQSLFSHTRLSQESAGEEVVLTQCYRRISQQWPSSHTRLLGVRQTHRRDYNGQFTKCSSKAVHQSRPQWLQSKSCQARCNRGFYCRSYCLLNMFRASLCPSSGAQEYYTVVAACGILCCGFFK